MTEDPVENRKLCTIHSNIEGPVDKDVPINLNNTKESMNSWHTESSRLNHKRESNQYQKATHQIEVQDWGVLLSTLQMFKELTLIVLNIFKTDNCDVLLWQDKGEMIYNCFNGYKISLLPKRKTSNNKTISFCAFWGKKSINLNCMRISCYPGLYHEMLSKYVVVFLCNNSGVSKKTIPSRQHLMLSVALRTMC